MTSTAPRRVSAFTCPSWCTDGDPCLGDHHGDQWASVTTGGLVPDVLGIEPPRYNIACVAPQFSELDNLPRGASLFGTWGSHNSDWQVDLTVAEARALAQAVLNAADTAESD